MAIGENGWPGKKKYFCHSCGGVTVFLTPIEAEFERQAGHDLEAFPLSGAARGVDVCTNQAQPAPAVAR